MRQNQESVTAVASMNLFFGFAAFVLFWAMFLATSSFTATAQWSNTKKSRVTSLVHSLVISTVALAAAPKHFPHLIHAHVPWLWSLGSQFEQAWQMVSVGYFLFDLTLMLSCTDVFEWAYVVHHCTVIASVVTGIMYGGAPANCLFLLHELSVPFSNLHHLLPRDSAWKSLNGAAVSPARPRASRCHPSINSPPPPNTHFPSHLSLFNSSLLRFSLGASLSWY